MHNRFGNGSLDYRRDQKRGDERREQNDGRDSPVPLEPLSQLLQVGTDKDSAGGLSLEHNLADHHELAILKPVSFYLTGGNRRQRQALGGDLPPVQGERSVGGRVDARRYDVGGSFQRR